MRFSVIVPIFRVEKYLCKCIESIINQDFNDFEIILVDDGSDDWCPQICDKYSKQYNNIKVIHKKNGGLVSARKAGAAISEGEYIINVDGDDFLNLDYLSTIDKFLNDEPNLDIIACSYTSIDNNRYKIHHSHVIENGIYSGNDMDIIRKRYLYDENEDGININSLIVSIWTKVVRRDLYLECQMMVDERITKGEDAMVVLLLLQKCKSLMVTDYSGYNYRLLENSMSHRITNDDFDILVILLKRMLDAVKVESSYFNKIYVYGLYRFNNLIVGLSKQCKNYWDFKQSLSHINPELIDIVLKSDIKKPRIKDKIKTTIIKHRKWFIYYSLCKLI